MKAPKTAKHLAIAAVGFFALLSIVDKAAAQRFVNFAITGLYTNGAANGSIDGLYVPAGAIIQATLSYSIDPSMANASGFSAGTVYKSISVNSSSYSTNFTTSLALVNFQVFIGGTNNYWGSDNSTFSTGFSMVTPTNCTSSSSITSYSDFVQVASYFNQHGITGSTIANGLYISPNSPNFFLSNMTVVSPASTNISLNSVGFTNGQFGFGVAGPAGSNVLVQASTNLQDWIPLATNTLVNGTNYFSDTNYIHFPRRFYRVRTQ